MGGHEIDRIGRGHLRGDHQIALILPVLIVDQNEHAPIQRFVDDLLCSRHHAAAIAREIRLQLVQRLGTGIPVRSAKIAQGVGVQPGGAGKTCTGHAPGFDQVGEAIFECLCHGHDITARCDDIKCFFTFSM